MLKMCLENAENNMQSHLNQELYNQQILKKIKQKLRLKNLPYKVECFDISNIQGKNSVASMVVMENNRENLRFFQAKIYRRDRKTQGRARFSSR